MFDEPARNVSVYEVKADQAMMLLRYLWMISHTGWD